MVGVSHHKQVVTAVKVVGHSVGGVTEEGEEVVGMGVQGQGHGVIDQEAASHHLSSSSNSAPL